MKTWDVIVVGAGPSGCAAAYDLATAGRSVLLLDRCDFPRPKACAGGLTMKAVRALRYSIGPVTREVVYRLVLENNGVKPTMVKTRAPICVMTVRSEFDQYCFRKTLGAGAVFRRVRGIKAIDQEGERAGDRITVDTGDEVLHSSYVIGADGVNSQVRRLCAGPGTVAGGFALEAKVPLQARRVDLTFDFGAVRNGYGWIFPKGDHLNVGLGFYGASEEKLDRERLVRYVQQKLGTAELEHVVGQYLGVSGRDSAYAYGRVLLAGDAAGLVDPLTAEGIYSAIVSGQAAARAIADALGTTPSDAACSEGARPDAGRAYAAALAPLREVLAFSARAARAFYANPDRGFQALTLPGLRTALLKTYAQGMNSSLILRVLQRARTA